MMTGCPDQFLGPIAHPKAKEMRMGTQEPRRVLLHSFRWRTSRTPGASAERGQARAIAHGTSGTKPNCVSREGSGRRSWSGDLDGQLGAVREGAEAVAVTPGQAHLVEQAAGHRHIIPIFAMEIIGAAMVSYLPGRSTGECDACSTLLPPLRHWLPRQGSGRR